MSDDILDLDALAPQPKKVKIGGKTYDCFPPKLKLTIRITQLGNELDKVTEPDELGKIIQSVFDEVIYTLIPAVKDDPTFDMTFKEVTELIAYLQRVSVPAKTEDGARAAQDFPVEKKTNLAEPSPSSAGSTPPTK